MKGSSESGDSGMNMENKRHTENAVSEKVRKKLQEGNRMDKI